MLKHLIKRLLILQLLKTEVFELSINTKNIDTENFKWNTSFTFTHATEKLTNIDLGNLTVNELISEGLFIGQTPASGGVFYDYKK